MINKCKVTSKVDDISGYPDQINLTSKFDECAQENDIHRKSLDNMCGITGSMDVREGKKKKKKKIQKKTKSSLTGNNSTLTKESLL